LAELAISYSGDTLPTANLVQVAYGTTLLIHEATLPDDEKALAFARAHTTTGQAIQIAEAYVFGFSIWSLFC
jgi:ribonuclease Z